MGTSNAPEWYIDAGGPKRGPYSVQQIEQFYRDGQVHPDTVLYNSHDPQNPTSVRNLLELSASALPARPSVDLNKPIIAPGSEDAAPDATLSLFLTLQSTKKKAAVDPNMERTLEKNRFSETQMWFAGAMVLIVGTLVWGTTKLLNYSNELGTKTEQPEAKIVNTAPPPIEHAAPSSPTTPSATQQKKTLSDYMPKTTHIAPPATRTAVAPHPARANDRERQRIKDRELEMDRERQRQRDLEYERERERDREFDGDREDLKKKILDNQHDDAGVLQQAPIPAPPPPPSDPDAPLID